MNDNPYQSPSEESDFDPDRSTDIPEIGESGKPNSGLQLSIKQILWIVGGGVVGILVLPLMTLPLTVLALFGFTCIRSAIIDRREGWGMGILMGLFMFLGGVGGLLHLFFTLVGEVSR